MRKFRSSEDESLWLHQTGASLCVRGAHILVGFGNGEGEGRQHEMRVLLMLIAGCLLFGPIASRSVNGAGLVQVDLELVLAVDTSSSIDSYEAKLQRDGYLFALSHPDVINAIQSGPLGRIAVIYVEFAGKTHQRIVVDWIVIDGFESAQTFIDLLSPRSIGSAPSTSISALIDFAAHQIDNNNFAGRRRVIDISADGPNSDGRPVWDARDDAIKIGITLNGLPVLSSRRDPGGFAPSVGVARHFRRFVIGGPGAFDMEVNEFETFAPTLLEKLLREIRARGPTS